MGPYTLLLWKDQFAKVFRPTPPTHTSDAPYRQDSAEHTGVGERRVDDVGEKARECQRSHWQRSARSSPWRRVLGDRGAGEAGEGRRKGGGRRTDNDAKLQPAKHAVLCSFIVWPKSHDWHRRAPVTHASSTVCLRHSEGVGSCNATTYRCMGSCCPWRPCRRGTSSART